MKVEIWSDVVCPFCYIGKRNFEHALEQFEQADDIKVHWRSFELQPGLKTDGSRNQYEHLAKSKGWTLDYSKKVHDNLVEKAKEVGLEYNFDQSIPANTFDAHRLSHLAKEHALQDKAEERLFKAHFTDGKNLSDEQTLVELGVEIGLDEDEIRDTLQSDRFADEVEKDKYAARQVGVQGVPYFVFNDKYAMSGAQPKEAFIEVLNKAYKEFEEEKKPEIITKEDGTSCSIDGNC